MDNLKSKILNIICRWHEPIRLDCVRCAKIFIEDHKLCNEDAEKLIKLIEEEKK